VKKHQTEANLAEVEALAREAGRLLMTRYRHPHDIRFKGAVDLVTEADHLSEEYLMGYLAEHHPTHAIITEESGSNHVISDRSWIIDPLDGTVNFAHGIPIFCVSIAYAVNGVVQLGVVFDPVHNECFSAEKGKGAWRNGNRLSVTNTSEVILALLATGFPYEKGKVLNRNLEFFTHFSINSRGVRRLGSAALDLCYVAAGHFDGYWELLVSPWDVAAGSLIAHEAGAKVTSVDGSVLKLETGATILAANPDLHGLLLRVLHPMP